MAGNAGKSRETGLSIIMPAPAVLAERLTAPCLATGLKRGVMGIDNESDQVP